MSSAVVFPSSVTDLSSGAGGGFTAAQSSSTSADIRAAKNEAKIMAAAAAIARRLEYDVSDMLHPFRT
jgi:hypothetical protein